MKLIDEFESAHDADFASLNYREKGILTHVSSRHSNSLRIITGAMKVGLWVVLEDQYQDAIELKKTDHIYLRQHCRKTKWINLKPLAEINWRSPAQKC